LFNTRQLQMEKDTTTFNFNVSSGKSFVCPSCKSFVCPSCKSFVCPSCKSFVCSSCKSFVCPSCKSFVCPSSLLTSRQRAFAQNVEVLLVSLSICSFAGRCISFNPQLSCYRQILSQKKSNDGEH
jgi:hypothetical protein